MAGTFDREDPEGYAPSAEQMAAWKKSAKDNPDNQNPARSNTNTGPTTSSTKTSNNPSRTIVGLMAITVIFAVAGQGVKTANGQTTTKAPGSLITTNGKIILGGFFATAALELLAEVGEAGQRFALGLAAISTVTAVLVYGGPVWKQANNLFGSTPTTPLSETTTAARPTTPTQGVQTAVSLAQAA